MLRDRLPYRMASFCERCKSSNLLRPQKVMMDSLRCLRQRPCVEISSCEEGFKQSCEQNCKQSFLHLCGHISLFLAAVIYRSWVATPNVVGSYVPELPSAMSCLPSICLPLWSCVMSPIISSFCLLPSLHLPIIPSSCLPSPCLASLFCFSECFHLVSHHFDSHPFHLFILSLPVFLLDACWMRKRGLVGAFPKNPT